MGQNSFEQMCINFVNEKVTQFCTRRLIKDELSWYSSERIVMPKIEFLDNQDVLCEFSNINCDS